MSMFDDLRVSPSGAGLPAGEAQVPATSGDPAAPATDANEVSAPQATPEPKMIPETQLNEFRSSYDQRIAAAERRAAEAERVAQEFQRTTEINQAVAQWEDYYAAQYPEADAYALRQAAQQAVQSRLAEIDQESEVEQLRHKVQTVEQREATQQRVRTLGKTVVDTFALEPSALVAATKHLRHSDPNFETEVWRVGAQLALQANQPTPSGQNRNMIQNTPFPGRGGSAAPSDGEVWTGPRGTAAHRAFVEAQETRRRNGY